MTGTLVVLAKAPVPGRVKTRLAQGLGGNWQAAAELAAAALLDTVAACTAAVGPNRCHLVLDGCLDEAVEATALAQALAGWSIRPQVGGGLDERIARAHEDVEGRVLQIGMDTPFIFQRYRTTQIDRYDLEGIRKHGHVPALFHGVKESCAIAPLKAMIRDGSFMYPGRMKIEPEWQKKDVARVAQSAGLSDYSCTADAL